MLAVFAVAGCAIPTSRSDTPSAPATPATSIVDGYVTVDNWDALTNAHPDRLKPSDKTWDESVDIALALEQQVYEATGLTEPLIHSRYYAEVCDGGASRPRSIGTVFNADFDLGLIDAVGDYLTADGFEVGEIEPLAAGRYASWANFADQTGVELRLYTEEQRVRITSWGPCAYKDE